MNVIYQAEFEAGLADKIRSSAHIVVASRAELSEPFEVSEKARASLRNHGRATAGVGDVDLHYLKSVLVSTQWNLNDDVFDPVEVWMAKATPVHKPINYEHTGSDIIGCTISSSLVGVDGKAIAVNSKIDDLPAKFHVLTEDVIYKIWHDPNLQERMDRTLAEIAKGDTWFVSMECLFGGFDYALKDGEGNTKVVARNVQTSFLTKHLRAYGGDGVYEGSKVGRVLRNITFSGKALVKRPANPDSVIIQDDIPGKSEALAQAVAAYFEEDASPAEHALVFSSQVERDITEFFASIKH